MCPSISTSISLPESERIKSFLQPSQSAASCSVVVIYSPFSSVLFPYAFLETLIAKPQILVDLFSRLFPSPIALDTVIITKHLIVNFGAKQFIHRLTKVFSSKIPYGRFDTMEQDQTKADVTPEIAAMIHSLP